MPPLTDAEIRELARQLEEALRLFDDVFTDDGLAQRTCGRTVSLGHAIGVSSKWFGSASESSSNAQSMASTRAFEHCLHRCGSLECPSGDCVFDMEANEGFTDTCRYFTIYLGIQEKFWIPWHVSLAFAKCRCVCKCV